MDPLSYGVVLDDPGTKNVVVKRNITFLKERNNLQLDIYLPPNLKASEERPAIIFLNTFENPAEERKIRDWGIYSTWPRLMAAYGYIGISMDADGRAIQESLQGVFAFISEKGMIYNIDKNNLGVYAASANVNQSLAYLMGKKVYAGIKAAVLYYGAMQQGPFRKDLPVFFVVSEGDLQRNNYAPLWSEVLKNNAPWTIKMGTGMPHAFDAYADNDDARRIIKETISFWQAYLDPIRMPSWKPSKAREALSVLRTDPQKAITLLQALMEEYPGDIRTLSFYASALADAKRAGEAEVMYKKILTLQPKNIIALLSLANLAYEQNRTEEGEQYLIIAENTGLMTAGNYGGVGYNFLVQGRDQEAAKYYEKAVAIEPNGHDYYNLACAYAKINNKDKAFDALEKSIRLDYGSKSQLQNDKDFDTVRSDERFSRMLGIFDSK